MTMIRLLHLSAHGLVLVEASVSLTLLSMSNSGKSRNTV